MKLLAILLAAAGLTACAYPAPYGAAYYGQGASYGQGGYYSSGVYSQPYVVEPSISIYGSTRYRSAPAYSGRHDRDRDHEGAQYRSERDRDGDGVPDRADHRPYDSRRN